MPKLKTKSGVKKRFKTTGSGKVKAKQAYARHMMMNKSKKMKRKARGMTVLSEADQKSVLGWLPYSRKKKNKTASKAAKGGK